MGTTPPPVGTILRPTRSTQPATDIIGFFAIVEQAMKLHLQTTSVPIKLQPLLVREFPQSRLSKPDDPFDVIISEVVAVQLATTSNTSERIGWRPVLRERYQHPTMAGYNIVTYGWWENVAIAFTVHGRSNGRADVLTNWFHRFLIKYAHMLDYFKARGIDHFTFVERQRDRFDDHEGQEIYKRTLVYQFRLENLESVLEKQLDNVDITVSSRGEAVTFTEPRS